VTLKEDRKLAKWVCTQRGSFKINNMGAERIRRLNEVGFDFNPEADNAELWNTNLEKLGVFKGNHGHCELFYQGCRPFYFHLEYPH
jgi:hypothetical protein